MIRIELYTDEEREKIWKDLADKIHYHDVDGRSYEELIRYIRDMEKEIYRLTNDRNYYKNICKNAIKYKSLVHVYKVELGRCRRKLTRIYKRLFNHFYCDFGDVEGAKSYVDYWRKNV